MMRNSKDIRKNTHRPNMNLGLPDLDHSKSAVLNSLRSPESQRRFPQVGGISRNPFDESEKPTSTSFTLGAHRAS